MRSENFGNLVKESGVTLTGRTTGLASGSLKSEYRRVLTSFLFATLGYRSIGGLKLNEV
jgi:hypothetical protein